MIAAGSAPAIEGLSLYVCSLGAVLLFAYAARRLSGHDLLPEGPSPTVAFRIADVVVILVAAVFLEVMGLGLAASLGLEARELLALVSKSGPLAVVCGVYLLALRRRVEHGPRLAGAAAGLAAWLATFPLVAVIFVGWVQLLSLLGREWEEQSILTVLRGSPALFLLIAVVLAPLIEEVLYRGMLYPALKRRLGTRPAMLISASIFAVSHMQLSVIPPLFVLGIALALVYERTGTLAAPLAFHAAFNGWTFVGEVLLSGGGSG